MKANSCRLGTLPPELREIIGKQLPCKDIRRLRETKEGCEILKLLLIDENMKLCDNRNFGNIDLLSTALGHITCMQNEKKCYNYMSREQYLDYYIDALDESGMLIANDYEEVNHYTNAANYGQFEMIKWLYEQGNPVNNTILAGISDLEIIKWLYERGCKNMLFVCECAAQLGHFDILKWAYEQGAPIKYINLEYISDLEIIKWLYERGSNRGMYDLYLNAKKRGNIDILEWFNSVSDDDDGSEADGDDHDS
jgi:hypothetical protein